MKHLSAADLSARLDGRLEPGQQASVDRHLEECAECREALASWAAQDDALKRTLTHDPGDAYFESFAARVEDRVRSAGLSGAQSRLEGGAFDWLRSPSRLAWVGAVAAIVAGAGLVFISSREVGRPGLDRQLSGRIGQVAPPSGPPPAGSTSKRDESKQESNDALRERERGPSSNQARPAPGQTRGASGPTAREEGAPAPAYEKLRDLDAIRAQAPSAPTTAARPAPSAGPPPAAGAPERLQPARRNVQGEEVPLRKEAYRFAGPPASTETKSSETIRVRKPGGAEPLEAESQPEGVAPSLAPAAGELSLCGRVLDPKGRPVAGAQIALADNARTAVTDANGHFCVASPEGDHELAVMAVGFQNQRAPVRVAGESPEVTVTLQPVAVLGQSFATLKQQPQDRMERLAGEAEKVGDPFASLSGDVRARAQRAQQLTTNAAKRRSASAFDGAARGWEELLARVGPGPARTAARLALANARVQAWQIAPNPTRVRDARTALASYLAVAPEGPDRDRALRWQEQLAR